MSKDNKTTVSRANAMIITMICSLLLVGCNTEDTRNLHDMAKVLLDAGKPVMHETRAPFQIGQIKDVEPSADAPWWTLEYGDFPVIMSSELLRDFAEGFADAHVGFLDRFLGIPLIRTDYTYGKDYVLSFFRSGQMVDGEYYDYAKNVRFEDAALNLLLLAGFDNNDKEYLEDGTAAIRAAGFIPLG